VVDDPSGFDISVSAPNLACGGSDIDVIIDSDPPGAMGDLFAGGTFTLTNESTQTVLKSGNITGPAQSIVSFNIDSIPGGTYTLFINAFGCNDQQPGIMIDDPQNADLSVAAVFDICSSDPTITAISGTSTAQFEWRQGGTIVGNTASVQVSGSGSYSVTVRDTTGVLCDTTAFVQVNLEPSPEPLIEPLTAGCDGTRQVGITNLTGTNYSYAWVNNANGQLVSNAPSVSIANSIEFQLTVRDQLTGCQGEDIQQVDVYQPLDVAVTVDRQACQDNNMVTLTATVLPAQNVTYEWYLNDVLLRDTVNFVETFNEGLYRAEVTDVASGSCTASGELLITRAPITPSNIEPFYIICP
jgi:hypothetical protein